jgi:hypothetical protein
MGPERSQAYLQTLPGTDAWFFLPDAGHAWTIVKLTGRR